MAMIFFETSNLTTIRMLYRRLNTTTLRFPGASVTSISRALAEGFRESHEVAQSYVRGRLRSGGVLSTNFNNCPGLGAARLIHREEPRSRPPVLFLSLLQPTKPSASRLCVSAAGKCLVPQFTFLEMASSVARAGVGGGFPQNYDDLRG